MILNDFFWTGGPTLSFCTEPANCILGPTGAFVDFWILHQDSDWAGLVWALDSVLLTASLICNLSALRFTRFKCIIQCILSIVRVLQPSPLSHSRKFSCPPKTPHFPLPPASRKSWSLSVTVCLSVLYVSYTQNQTTRLHCCPAFFIQRHVFNVNPCGSLCQCLIPFHSWTLWDQHVLNTPPRSEVVGSPVWRRLPWSLLSPFRRNKKNLEGRWGRRLGVESCH